MSTRTTKTVYCDGCGKSENDVDIVSTKVATVGFGGKTIMKELGSELAQFQDERKRRDYCQDCLDSDIFYCEECNKPHQFECPVEAAKLDAEWAEYQRQGKRRQSNDLPF